MSSSWSRQIIRSVVRRGKAIQRQWANCGSEFQLHRSNAGHVSVAGSQSADDILKVPLIRRFSSEVDGCRSMLPRGTRLWDGDPTWTNGVKLAQSENIRPFLSARAVSSGHSNSMETVCRRRGSIFSHAFSHHRSDCASMILPAEPIRSVAPEINLGSTVCDRSINHEKKLINSAISSSRSDNYEGPTCHRRTNGNTIALTSLGDGDRRLLTSSLSPSSSFSLGTSAHVWPIIFFGNVSKFGMATRLLSSSSSLSSLLPRGTSSIGGGSAHSQDGDHGHGRRSTPRQSLAEEMARATSGRSRTMLLYLVAIVIGMVGTTYAAVPLYRMFCQATGFGGTVKRRQTVEEKITSQEEDDELVEASSKREVIVYFNADVAENMAWKFAPCQREVVVKPGDSTLAFYTAHNTSDKAVTGVSTYNVSPTKAGAYFNKIQCFCFEEQRLQAGEKIDMPVFFYIDREFATDPKMDDITSLTLSYTFFKVEDEEEEEMEMEKGKEKEEKAEERERGPAGGTRQEGEGK